MQLRQIGRRLPRPIRTAGVLTLYAFQVLGRAGGTRTKECPCCGFTGRFTIYGHPPRYDARCPGCGSNERQRLLALAMERDHVLHAGMKAIYFMPEPVLVDYLQARQVDFTPVWVTGPDFIDADDNAFDLVMASNILEHAKDDAQTLSELRRVLKPDGAVMISVPLIGGWDGTYENPDVVTDEDRLHHFGERNHFRYYGRDIKDRIIKAGFEVSEYVVSGEETVRYGVLRGDRVFVARPTAVGQLRKVEALARA